MTEKHITAEDFAKMTDKEKSENYQYLSDEEYSKFRIFWDPMVSCDEPYSKAKSDELKQHMKSLKNDDLSDLPEDDPIWVGLNKAGHFFDPKKYKGPKS